MLHPLGWVVISLVMSAARPEIGVHRRTLPLPVRIFGIAVVVLIIQLTIGLGPLARDARCFEEGRRAFVRDDYQVAIERSREFLQRYPDSADAWARLGISLVKLGQMREGEAAMRRAVELGPSPFYAKALERELRLLPRTGR